MSEEIINKVARSGLVTIDLEDHYIKGERALLDIRQWLYEDLILKEKDFREYIKQHQWEQYKGKMVAVTCTADAIVPTWAFMLVASSLAPFASRVFFGSLQQMEEQLFHDSLKNIDPTAHAGQRVVIKGCAGIEVPVAAYVELTAMLQPYVKSIMYGEPCSTVPVFKSK
jgi:hypothetical protein